MASLLGRLAGGLVLALLAGVARGQTPHLVVDLNPLGASSDAQALRVSGGALYFVATDSGGRIGLWRTDGTVGNATKLAEIGDTGTYRNSAYQPTDVNGRLFFVGPTASGSALWTSDGTAAGTMPIAVFSGLAQVSQLTSFAGMLVFVAPDYGDGTELWRSDGTAVGTVPVADINPSGGSYPRGLTVAGGVLYFAATEPSTGTELWRSDGTAAGTMLVADIAPGSASSNPGLFTAANGLVFFTANDAATGYELWRTDGTAGGTFEVADINPGSGGSNAFVIGVSNGIVYLSAYEPVGGQALWKTDGTAPGTVRLGGGQSPRYLTDLNGSAYFFSYDPVNASALWKSDGTPGGTVAVRSVIANATPLRVGNELFFAGYDNIGGTELWKSDGTTSGTGLAADVYPGAGGSMPGDLTAFTGDVFFSAGEPTGERELWRSDGTGAGTVKAVDITPAGSAGSLLSHFVDVGGTLYFILQPGPTSGQTYLWQSDGTAAGTLSVSPDSPRELIAWNGRLFFASDTGLERLDAGQTTLLTSGAAIHDLTVAGGLLYFYHSAAVARSDGTAAGTVDLATILGQQICSTFGCTNLPSNPRFFTALGGQVLFVADAASGFELWKTDGTAAGTSRLANVGTGWGGEPLGTLRAVNGVVYFAALHHELWRSDGMAAGTTLVADIGPASDPAELTDLGGTLVFVASDASGGRELWTSDGTAGGTARIIDLNPGAADASPAGLTVVGGRLYFAATEPAGGRELWTSDGTAGGTTRVADIDPGPGSSNPTGLVALDGRLYFSASEPGSGAELWRSDGTAGGTVRLADANPGPDGSRPAQITPVGGGLFFTAFLPATGSELWTLSPQCDAGAPDGDGDGLCDALDLCTNVGHVTLARPRLTVRKLLAGAGGQTLKLTADLTVPTSPPIDPVGKGIRVLIADAMGGTVADVRVPNGDYARATKTGWRRRGNGWRFVDPSGLKASVKGDPLTPGFLRVGLSVTHRTYTVTAAGLPLAATVVVDAPRAATGQCGELAFLAGACGFDASGQTVTCRP